MKVLKNRYFKKNKALTQIQTIGIIAIILVAAIIGVYIYRSPGSTPETPDEPEPEPTTMKRVLRSTWAFPTYIDPHVGMDRSSNAALLSLYDPLIKMGPGGTIVPWVITDWESSPDGLTWELTVQEGIMFHDGTEMTAEDVAFSINRHIQLGTGHGYVLEPHVYPNATATDDNTVMLKLKHTFGPLITAFNLWYVLNKDVVLQNLAEGSYGDYGDYGQEWLLTHEAGSGPYTIRSFILEEKLVLEKWDGYWLDFAEKAPDIVEMLATTEPVTVRVMMANGELEYTDPWQSLESNTQLKEIEGVTIAGILETLGNWQLMINTKKAPCDDVHFRRALMYLMDYEKVVNELFPGTVRCVGPIPNAMLGFDPTTYQYYYDIEKAQEELALSKYANNYTDYQIEVHWAAEVPDQEKVGMLLMAECDKLGININLQKTPWTSIVAETSSLETSPHMAYIGADGDFLEAGSYLFNRYHSSTATAWRQNEWLLNETLDSMIEDALKTRDFDERMEKYSIIQKEVADQAPTIWLYILVAWHAYPDYVTPHWISEGEKIKTVDELGDVILYYGNECEFRLFEVDRLIEYEN